MEFLGGGDLATLLKHYVRFTEKEMRRYIAETILAIEYIHEYGIVHRDLKPDNLLLTENGHVKLTDFGLSRIGLMQQTAMMDSPTIDTGATFQDNEVLGTPDYIAPEVIVAQPYGPAVDWWSLGVIAYEFLIGVPPFHADTISEIFRNTLHNDVVVGGKFLVVVVGAGACLGVLSWCACMFVACVFSVFVCLWHAHIYVGVMLICCCVLSSSFAVATRCS